MIAQTIRICRHKETILFLSHIATNVDVCVMKNFRPYLGGRDILPKPKTDKNHERMICASIRLLPNLMFVRLQDGGLIDSIQIK